MNTTQGATIVAALRRRWMTYGDMLRLNVSTCPHKRVAEWLDMHQRRDGVKLDKRRRPDGLVQWRVVPHWWA